MSDKHRKITLQNAIKKLPAYESPAHIWEHIQQELVLQEVVQKLPQYGPPTTVWNKIESDLPTAKPKLFWLRKWAIAASILLILGIAWWDINPLEINQLSYSIEAIDPSLLATDWDDDATLLAEIEAICEFKKFTCTDTEFQNLEQELEELNEAKSQLTTAIASYGKDTELIIQLTEIELERTTVLKKMIATIL